MGNPVLKPFTRAQAAALDIPDVEGYRPLRPCVVCGRPLWRRQRTVHAWCRRINMSRLQRARRAAGRAE